MDQDSVDVTAALLRPDAVRVAFTLAHHEFRDLDHDETDGWGDVEHFASQERCVCPAERSPSLDHSLQWSHAYQWSMQALLLLRLSRAAVLTPSC